MKKLITSAALAVLLLTGCGGANNNTPANSQQATETTQTEQTQKKESTDKTTEPATTDVATDANTDDETPFVASYLTDFANIAPLGDVSAETKAVLRNMNEGLYYYTPDGDIHEGIAEKIDITTDDDYVIFDIKIREGLKFHDGSDLTTEDVKYSFERLAGLVDGITADDVTGSGYFPELLNSEEEEYKKGKIEIADDYNMTVYFSNKFGVLTTQYSVADALLVPSDYPEDEQKTNPVGIGPYKFVAYNPGTSIEFTRFDDYYGDKPQVKNIKFLKFADATAIPLAFDSGEIDMMTLSDENYETYANQGLYVFDGLSNDVRTVFLNMRDGRLFENKDLRYAINYAIDKEKMNQTLTNGRGKVLYTHFTPVLEKYYNTEVEGAFGYDPEKAKEHLKKAGYPDGLDVTLYTVAEATVDQDMAALMVEDLQAVGINVTHEPLPWNTYYEQVYSTADFDMELINIVGYPDPSRVLSRYASDSSTGPGLENPEYDELLERARQSADEAEVIECYKKMQQILVDEAPCIFTVDPGVSVVLSEKYQGYEAFPFAFTNLATVEYK